RATRVEGLSPDAQRWAELRQRLRMLLADGMREDEIAAALGLAVSTFHRHLARVRKPPSRRVIAAAAALLAVSRETPGEQAGRLSNAQRERLAFLAEHGAPDIRREAHVTHAELDQALAGEVVGAEVVGRLTALLTTG